MKISHLNIETLTDCQRTELLYKNIHDDGKIGDCIFVPGSSKAVKYRLPKAIELYKAGRAPKILFSGGVIWEDNGLPEGEMLKQKAIELGVSSEDILVENHSMHTKENVLASLLILDRTLGLHNINRLVVVTTYYHMRRLYLNLKTFMPQWIEYSLCPVNDETTKPDNWFNNPHGRKRVEMEAAKLISYVQKGYICDDDIDINEV